MPSSMSDFINTFINMAQLQNQQEQTENARKSQAVQGVNTFMTLARQTADPAMLTGLVDRFSTLGVAPKEELLSILHNVTPTQEALKAYSTKQGMLDAAGHPTDSNTDASRNTNREAMNTELTGHDQSQLAASDFLTKMFAKVPTTGPQADMMAAGLGSQATAHTTPGQLVLDHAMSLLSPGTLAQGSRIGLGTELSAPQAASNQRAKDANELGWANARIQDRQVTQYGALQEAGFATDLAKTGMTSGARDQSHIPNLLATKEQLVSKLTDSKSPPPPALVTSYIGALNAINQQLTASGIANEGQIEYSPEMMTNPSWVQSIKQRFAGQNNITFTPQPPRGRGGKP